MPEFDYTNYGPVYREIPEFHGYRVGTDGSVWSKKYGRWVERKPGQRPNGYFGVSLYMGGVVTLISIHRIVLVTFVGQCPDGCEAAHDNGVRSDNRPCNLSWKTHAENLADNVKNGTSMRGDKHPRALLSESQVRMAREMSMNGVRHKAIAAKFGVCRGTISKAVSGVTWSHI